MRAVAIVLPVATLRARLHDLRDDWPLTLLGLVVLVTATVLVIRRASVLRWLFFVVAAVAWLGVDGPLDGPTLLPVVRRHGITLGDLLPLALAAVAATLSLQRKRVDAA